MEQEQYELSQDIMIETSEIMNATVEQINKVLKSEGYEAEVKLSFSKLKEEQ